MMAFDEHGRVPVVEPDRGEDALKAALLAQLEELGWAPEADASVVDLARQRVRPIYRIMAWLLDPHIKAEEARKRLVIAGYALDIPQMPSMESVGRCYQLRNFDRACVSKRVLAVVDEYDLPMPSYCKGERARNVYRKTNVRKAKQP